MTEELWADDYMDLRQWMAGCRVEAEGSGWW